MLLHCSSTAEMLSRGVGWLFCSWCVLYDIKKHTLDKLETWFSLEGYNTVQKFKITFLDSDKNYNSDTKCTIYIWNSFGPSEQIIKRFKPPLSVVWWW